MYTYTDFMGKNVRRTKGKFCGWTTPTGPLEVPYAIFRNRYSEIVVPLYCVTKETLEKIGRPEKKLEGFIEGIAVPKEIYLVKQSR